MDSLDADEKTADWQVREAAGAVILYVEQYLRRALQQISTLAKMIQMESKELTQSL